MAYNSDYLLMVHNGGGKGPSTWTLFTDSTFAASVGTDFITDASTRGMRKGDIVYAYTDAATVTTLATAKSSWTKWRPLVCDAIDADGNGTLQPQDAS